MGSELHRGRLCHGIFDRRRLLRDVHEYLGCHYRQVVDGEHAAVWEGLYGAALDEYSGVCLDGVKGVTEFLLQTGGFCW